MSPAGTPGESNRDNRAAQRGRELLSAGKVAAFTVAGGQGTRLGYDGPKGTVVVSPIGQRTLFQLFAETVLAARQKYAAAIPWYVMTSPANHAATVDFFSQRHCFGLPKHDVIFFQQGTLPAFDFHGRLLLESKDSLALAPDGHGGSLKALVSSGAIHNMRQRGVEIISYFQVDNPLVKPFDPLFVGLHALTGSEMSTKVARKADDLEKVGNLCLRDGKLVVVEYSDFPEGLAKVRNPDGTRTFDFGNLAMHLLAVDFVDRVAGRSFQLPLRRADKAVPCLDERGCRVQSDRPNAVKLEMFVFDALPLARSPLLLEVDRAEEFSPIKNASGVDSLETARRDQLRRACRWLESSGLRVPRRPDGQPDIAVYIAPTFALDSADVASKRDQIPPLTPAAKLVLE